MAQYLIRRAFFALISIFAISVIAFVIIQLPPGDYVHAYVSYQEYRGLVITDEEQEALRRTWGLDKPLVAQYGKWMYNLMQGNFGYSMEYRIPVRQLIADRFWMTIAVAGGAIVFTWLVAVPIGIYSALRQYSAGDHVFTF